MEDLVEILRWKAQSQDAPDDPDPRLLIAAVDEIERLRTALETESALREHWGKQWEEQYAENERLRTDLGAAYAELRKQSGNVRGIFDRDVWDRALAAPKPEDGK